MVEHHDRPSYEVLPELLANGRQIDLAYVDSLKVFDLLLVDVFFLTRLLRVGGVLVFDDRDWPGVRKLVRYMASLPHWRVRATLGAIKASRRCMWSLAIARGVPFTIKIFREDLAVPDDAVGVSAARVAFEKIGEDTRRWDWFSG